MSTIAPTGTDAELLRRARAELDAMPALTLPRLAARLGVTAAQIRDADQAGAVLGRIIATDASRQSATFTGHLLDGKTLQEIGDAAGLTRERVRQIIAAHGYDASAGTLVRRQGKIAALAAAAVPVREHLLANPGLTRDELAERTGADHAVLTVALRDPAVRRLLNHQGRGQDTGIPQAEIQRLLREAAAAVGADGLSRVAYDRWRDPAASVSGVRILQRHNSWRAACAAAGVQPGRQTRVRYTRRWDETSLRGWPILGAA